MNRKTLTALAVFAVLGVIAIVKLRQPDIGERASDRPRPLAKIDGAALDTLEVTRSGVTAVITRDAGKYKVTAPVATAADEANAKAAFEAMEKLDISDLVTEQKAKQTDLQVDGSVGVHVVAKAAKQGGTVLADIVIGKAQGSGTMVRISGKDEVWQAAGSLRYTFDKSLADWRDRSVTTFTAGDAETIQIKAKDGSHIALKKKEKDPKTNEDKWEVTDASPKIDELDTAVPNVLVSTLAAFKTNEFADGVKAADAGLEPPVLTVTVGLKGGKSSTLLIGNKKGDDEIYAKLPDSPQIFVSKKFNIERVAKAPIEFRDKTLCDIASGDLEELSVANADKSFAVSKTGGNWKATKPAKLDVDTARVTSMASALKAWKATSFAEAIDPKTVGLAKPKVITAKPSKKGQAACTVKVGDETKDKQSYYAQTGKGTDVYIVPKWSVDRFLVKPDDLKKGASGSAPANPHAGHASN
jgi:hypothetical protein